MKKIFILLFVCVAFAFSASARVSGTKKVTVMKFPVVFTLPCGFTVYGDYQCPGCTIQQMLQGIGQAGLQLQQQLCGTPPPVTQ